MFKSNSENRLYIATVPTGATDEAKVYKLINYTTELKYNYSAKKEDRVYFHNGGQTTSITTGVSHSLSVSIDYNDQDEAHKYLLNLLLGDVHNSNGQFIKIELRSASKTENKFITIKGKATINFKNHIPSGNADEYVKLEFDIMPQDDAWVVEESNL